jgi:hypothetical protein
VNGALPELYAQCGRYGDVVREVEAASSRNNSTKWLLTKAYAKIGKPEKAEELYLSVARDVSLVCSS